jgi:hypothetical protein
MSQRESTIKLLVGLGTIWVLMALIGVLAGAQL